MKHIKDLWLGVRWVQALLVCVAAEAWVGLVEWVGLEVVMFLLRVIRARQVAAAAPGSLNTTTATWRVAELGDGARRESSGVWTHKVI